MSAYDNAVFEGKDPLDYVFYKYSYKKPESPNIAAAVVDVDDGVTTYRDKIEIQFKTPEGHLKIVGEKIKINLSDNFILK